MKLLMLSSVAPYPSIDGCSITVAEVARAIAKQHDLTLVFFASPLMGAGDAEQDKDSAPYRSIALRPRRKMLGMLPFHWPMLFTRVPVAVFPFISRASKDQIRRLLAEERYDGIVCHMAHTSELVPVDCDIPSCMIIQDVVSHAVSGTRVFERSWYRRLYNDHQVSLLGRYERKHYRRFDSRTVVSEAEKVRAMKLQVGAVEVVPNGVDVEYFKPTTPIAQRRHLIYVGNMLAPRNEEAAWIAASQILPLVREGVPDAVLIVVGVGPSQRLLQLAEGQGNLIVTGEVPDVRPFLNRARVFLVPQTVGTGIKTSVLQALSMKAPVLSTAAGLEGFDGAEGQDYVRCESVSAFAESAILMFDDVQRAECIGANGRKLVAENYSWDAYASSVERLLSDSGTVKTCSPD